MKRISHPSRGEVPDETNALIGSVDINSIHFPNERYKRVAEIMQQLGVLEESLHTKHRLLQAADIPPDATINKSKETMEELKRDMHDLLLKTHAYPKGPRLVLTQDDAKEFGHRYQSGKLEFRDADAENLAFYLGLIVNFQYELAGHLVNRGDYEEGERQAMIEDTTRHLHSNIEHIMDILTGEFDKPRKRRHSDD